jgi:hypothetical protein
MSKYKHWFIKKRGSYIPCSWQGWLCYIPYIAYIIAVLVYVDVRNDSFWSALFTAIPNWVVAGVIMTWFARSKS